MPRWASNCCTRKIHFNKTNNANNDPWSVHRLNNKYDYQGYGFIIEHQCCFSPEIFANCDNVSMPTLLSNLPFFSYQQGIQLSVSALQYPPFFVDPCLFMNGGCASFCESDNFVVTCSCEPGYDIQPDGSCTANRKELCRLGGQKFDTKLLKCVGRY